MLDKERAKRQGGREREREQDGEYEEQPSACVQQAASRSPFKAGVRMCVSARVCVCSFTDVLEKNPLGCADPCCH